tara:strand:- start:203 stop:442 length:240 start_codon:yes stop_codon:yes gene_type:complete
MSKLSKRCEERKAEAQALADKYNALNEQGKKLDNEKAKIDSEKSQILGEFNIKNSQYAELCELVKEEEVSQEVSSETVD